ncbi:MAG: MBL fold metallo-hydrolase [Aestuariivita sp.]|nr:MBL fold metallo-hydrolase [Aestuariivita sp.]MCY4346742.1 MBL fold metallo-hydrolase [Aestuariivita sp.]
MNGIYQVKVGDFRVTAISDGHIPLPRETFIGVDEDQFNAALTAASLPEGDYEAPINAFIVEQNGRVHLVDSGAGTLLPSLGKVGGRIIEAGYAPEQVETLFVSHLHPDHVGGATDDNGPVFPNAALIVHEADHAFWTNPDNRASADDGAKLYFDIASNTLTAYQERLRLISGEEQVISGVTALPLPGHTPGHCGFTLSSGSDQLLIWSDIVHMQYLQLKDPNVAVAFDTDPQSAAIQRKKILDQAASDHLLVAGMHLAFPGMGQVEKAADGQGYWFVPNSVP